MKLSIIIPVYNSEKYIKRCLDSILNQSFSDFEVICLNDGSTDKSLDILKKYEKKDKRIRVFSHDNQGIARTRNKGIKLAKGEYVMFIDNDDYIDFDYLEKYYNSVKGYDIVIGGYRRITETKKVIESRNSKETEWGKFIIVAPWAKIFKRNLIVKNNIEFLPYGIGEDIFFYIQCLDKTNKIKSIDYIGYNWFYNTQSVSNTDHKGLNDDIDIIFLINSIKKKITDNNIDKITLEYFYVRLAFYYLLYSGRYSSRYRFKKEYNYIINYLNENIPNYRNLLKKNIPYDEDYKVKFILKMFTVIDSLHLISLFSWFYCKGDE